MALEEKEKITIIEAILEAEEEVKITPPARRKKAERLKNKANENSPKPACEDETNDSSVTDINDGSSLTGAKLNETDDIETSKQELSSQVNAMNNTESHEAKNGILENSVTAEVSDKERPFGNTVENSCVESEEELAALVNETNSLRDSEENEKVAATLSAVSDIKEEPREGLESSISPDITSGNVSQDDESFFSAEEAETTSEFINSSSTLPNLTEVVNETTVESDNKEVLSPVISKNTSTNETVADDLERGGQERSRDQISNRRLQTSSEDLKESFENRDIIPEISDEHSLSTDTDLTDNSFTVNDSGTSATVRIDSPDSDLLADTDLGAVGGVLESDSDSDEVWSSSSNTSSEGEYDVGYFESNRGIQVSFEDWG